jgi:hypothetical protein
MKGEDKPRYEASPFSVNLYELLHQIKAVFLYRNISDAVLSGNNPVLAQEADS